MKYKNPKLNYLWLRKMCTLPLEFPPTIMSSVEWKQFLEQTELMASFCKLATSASEKAVESDPPVSASEGEKTSTLRGLSIDPNTKAAGCFGSKHGRKVLNHLNV